MNHARDWHVVPEWYTVPDSNGLKARRSRRTNICEIPNYKFVGGTVDKASLERIDCPRCLVLIDGFFASGSLQMLEFIRPLGALDALAEHPEFERVRPAGLGTRLLHGRDTT